MKHLTFVTLAIAASLFVVEASPLTPEQTLDRRAIGDLEFSPDGSRLVFTVTEPVTGAARARAIWVLDIGSGRARPLTFSGKSDGSPRWAPDGSAIAFTSDREGPSQLYRLSMRGGEAEKLTDRREAVGAFRWSPDGARIALMMTEPTPEAQRTRERDKDDSRVVDKDDRRARIWMLDLASRALTQITNGNWRIGQIEWLPSGDRLIAAASPNPASDQWNERIYSIDVKDGRFTEIGAPRGPMGALAVSPDGKTIAYVGARVDGPDAHDVFVLPAAGGAARNLTASAFDKPASQPKWIDNRVLAVHVARGFASTLAIVDAGGRAQMIDNIGVNPSAFAVTRGRESSEAANDSRPLIAYVGETATKAPEVWIKFADADLTSRRLTDSPAHAVTTVNQQWASIPVVAPEFVKYTSFDGVEIEAALLQPPATTSQPPATSHQPHPFVVLVHGGPTGRWSDTFEPWGQLLAARGYAVLYPNVRGSTGYGQRFVEMNRADWGGGDFKDVMAGVDWAIARGIADPNRLGIGGWSYGGYMAAWAVTQTTRFKAAVSGAPVIDMASEFGTENGSAYDEWFYGTPYERDKLDGFIKSSPMTFVKNVKTPTLLLQGEDDTTDPIGQSQQFYRGLKRYGVDADLVLYPREPHGLREEKHLLDRLNRIVAWYEKYLSGGGASTAQR
ncbi:MAG: S9 family peptidase [Acidobacteriia bacterium]|nr:S9 family peptidase [Terriglobia bacterium]